MTIAQVGTTATNYATTGTNQSLTFQTMTVGSLVIVPLSCGDTSPSPTSITSAACSGGFTQDDFSNHVNNSGFTAIYSAICDTAGHNDITVNMSGAVTGLYTTMYEFTGTDVTGSRKDTSGHTAVTTAPYTGSNITPGATSELFIATGTFNTAVNHGCLVAAGSNGVDVATFAGAGTLNVQANTLGLTSGTVYVETSAGQAGATITYTGGGNNVGSTTLTGCTTIAGSGTLTTSNRIAQDPWIENHETGKFNTAAFLIATNSSAQQVMWGPNASNVNSQISTVVYKVAAAVVATTGRRPIIGASASAHRAANW